MMAHESRGLGRGLQALLGGHSREVPAVPGPQGNGRLLPIGSIQSGPSQPRKSLQSQPLEELAASIKTNGVIQPIVVRPIPKAAADAPVYEIVAGERRWQAAKLAGLAEIPVVVRELSDQEAVAVALIENIQREELTPAEEARSLKRLTQEFALTHQAVASAVGRSRAAVTNLIRLLELPAPVVALIDDKRLSMGHARALLGLADEAERVRLGTLVAEREWSVRETESQVRKSLAGGESAANRPKPAALSEVLKTPFLHVQMRQKASGAGRLIVEFQDSVTRDSVIAALRGMVESSELY